MNPIKKPILKEIRTISVFILLLLGACNPTVAISTPVVIQDLPTLMPSSPTVEPTLVPTLASALEQAYPYYRPLATKLENVSQTIGDVTAQIDWAYVDEGRVAIQYTISGLEWSDGSTLDGMQQVQMSIPALSGFRLGGFSGASGGNVSYAQNGVITGSSDQALLDGALDADKYPEINVRVEIPVEGPTKVGTFHLNFTIPVVNGIKIENIDQTVVANQVSMTLKSLILNPSHVEALICFQMPSSSDWGLMTSVLTVNGRDYPTSGAGLAQGTDGRVIGDPNTNRCDTVGFDIVPDASTTSVTLTIPRLQASVNEVVTKEVVDRANQRLAERGLQFDYVNVDHGGNILVLQRPAGATDPEIYPLIWDAMADQYNGPWVFTVELPK